MGGQNIYQRPFAVFISCSLLITLLAFRMRSRAGILMGIPGTIIYFIHLINITCAQDHATGFEQAFGNDWSARIAEEKTDRFLSRRYVLLLPESPEPVFHQDILYYKIPDSGRNLLCDIWQPAPGIRPSGLAFIYVHGSAWYFLEKDVGTRTFFRYLTAQGHVIMDISYRLYPETNFMGMVHDVKHAIAWMKTRASVYGVNPDKIIVGGGSAGAHLSMLAAYTAEDLQFAPNDLKGADLNVRGVISLYGPSDLKSLYYHTGQNITSPKKDTSIKTETFPPWIQKKMGKDFHRLGFDKDPEKGLLVYMLDGTPEEKPEEYARFSPLHHVHRKCPATLLIQGSHDIITPVNVMLELHTRLKKAGVPVVSHILPQADHAFDLIQPRTNPAAHNCYYDVERFLALMN
jgi:acetyl esterase/lipase